MADSRDDLPPMSSVHTVISTINHYSPESIFVMFCCSVLALSFPDLSDREFTDHCFSVPTEAMLVGVY